MMMITLLIIFLILLTIQLNALAALFIYVKWQEVQVIRKQEDEHIPHLQDLLAQL